MVIRKSNKNRQPISRSILALICWATLSFLTFSSELWAMGSNQGAAPAKAVKKGPPAVRPVVKPAVPEVIQITVPAGASIRARLNQELKTSVVRTGTIFTAGLAEPLVVGGQVVAPLGALLEGFISSLGAPSRFRGGGLMELRLTRIINPDQTAYSLNTQPYAHQGRSNLTRNIGLIVAGGVLGAGLGSMLGQTAGALIGIGIGGGTGTLLSWGMGKSDLILHAGTELVFNLSQPVIFSIKPTPAATVGPK